MKNIKNLLVVDDDEIYLYLIKAIVRKMPENLDVLTAKNGEEALSKLSEKHPDLILLDLNMPVMNGWKFLDKIQGTPANFKLYIVTSSIDPSDRQMAEDNKLVNGFIEKPLTQQKLTKLISENVSLS